MPELPEVETMRRGIMEAIGSEISGLDRPRCRHKPISIRPRLDAFRRRALGQSIESVDRIGKRVILRLSSQEAIVFEPRMTGLVLLADPPDTQHLRFCLKLSKGKIDQIRFWDRRGLGSVQLMSPNELRQRLGPSHLGPDALHVNDQQLRQRLHTSRRQIKTALLDHARRAGIGNLYASEILHVAGIHPRLRCHRLTRDQWSRLRKAIMIVLEQAIRYEGSTLSDGTYRNALNRAGDYQKHHRVYDRKDQLCPTCQEDVIRRIVQTQRCTFYCPKCQSTRGKTRRPSKPR